MADFQIEREAMNHVLQDAIRSAQRKYKTYADRKRTEVVFEVGDWMFLKLQPYRQLSLTVRKYLKLSHKFFGPY